eukprot:TRINITY_DN2434_c0_g2_i3.p1 TRINITY_DN2434_c0_g2~~TRINITY_DN2434_c0_g2_i3.p1  ORF type:complete len:169 (-),score=56.92 TRINITY_DN2434_c0_g2_i3:354-860(-)
MCIRDRARATSQESEKVGDSADPPPAAAAAAAAATAEDKKPCWFFTQGKCTKGDGCPFSHTTPVSDPTAVKKKVCVFYLRGSCTKGEGCAFSHEGEPRQAKKRNCSFFQRGACNKGEACPFSHEMTSNKIWIAPGADGMPSPGDVQQLSDTLPGTPPHMQQVEPVAQP